MERLISTKHAQLHLRKARTARSTEQPSHRATTVNEAVRRALMTKPSNAHRSCQNGRTRTAMHRWYVSR